MSSLIVEVCEIDKILKHKKADKLEICLIKGWENITKIGQFKVGDKVVFIPPDSLVPRPLAEKWGVTSYLAGKPEALSLRVKSVRLRGEMSYGLAVVCDNPYWEVGKDVAEYYGIQKYDPPVRSLMGDAAPDDIHFPKMADIENIRNEPNTFTEGQLVAVTEKIDGSANSISLSPCVIEVDSELAELDQELYFINDKNDDNFDYNEFAIWKARSHKVNRKRPKTIEEMKKNTYWMAYLNNNVYDMIEHLFFDKGYKNIQLWGEIIGPGVSGGAKSLHYGLKNEFSFFAYALFLNGVKCSFAEFYQYCSEFGVETVPLIEVMPYNFEYAVELSKGNSVLAAKNGVTHIREGVVICSYDEPSGSIAKFLNPDYLILKEEGKIEDFTDA
jgi:RNA ligase (TIGR02306 family)